MCMCVAVRTSPSSPSCERIFQCVCVYVLHVWLCVRPPPLRHVRNFLCACVAARSMYRPCVAVRTYSTSPHICCCCCFVCETERVCVHVWLCVRPPPLRHVDVIFCVAVRISSFSRPCVRNFLCVRVCICGCAYVLLLPVMCA